MIVNHGSRLWLKSKIKLLDKYPWGVYNTLKRYPKGYAKERYLWKKKHAAVSVRKNAARKN